MVYLTTQEEKMLNGEYGEAISKAMQILYAIAKIKKAKKMIKVKSVQISGVSYKTIGDSGLEFIKYFSNLNVKVKVKSFLNPCGMDRYLYEKMNIPKEFAKKQIKIMNYYEKMNIEKTYTCTPYHLKYRPKINEHLAWAESNAVSFANSIIGAKTNREGGPSALACAITGVTPYYGLHEDKNRVSKIKFKIEATLKNRFDYGVLGSIVGKITKQNYPSFENLKNADELKLKYLGASMAATGSVPFFMVKNKTPEWNLSDDFEEIIIEEKQFKEEISVLNTTKTPEIIAIGCPHASIEEIKEIAEKIIKNKNKKVMIFTSREIKEKAIKKGYLNKIQKNGGQIYCDTCMVVMPLYESGIRKTAVNSAKAANYLPSFNKQKIKYASIDDLFS